MITTQKIAHGAWRATSEALGAVERALHSEGTEWSGTCQKCGTIKAAAELVWARLPFGRGEIWACRGGC